MSMFIQTPNGVPAWRQDYFPGEFHADANLFLGKKLL